MRAAIHDRYGDLDVLRIDEVARPVPAADEVLVEVHTATVNRTDCGFRLARPFIVPFFSGLLRPRYRTLGTEFAGVVVDYERTDLTATGDNYDVVFDAVGKSSFFRCRSLVRRGGRYVSTDLGFMWQNVFLSLLTLKFVPTRIQMPLPKYTRDKVATLASLVESGDFRAVIDRSYPLDQVVAATAYVETQQKQGNVLIEVRGE
jgi:NADPH:quinone reductase-like Zn-dependent oxidoreductase